LIGSTEQDLRMFFEDGLQISEVAIVNDFTVYSFSGVDSGVVLDDGFSSYSSTYAQTTAAVPEPTALGMLLLTPLMLLRRRK
jgi:hypothetical protein